jgi:hypothetical protein
VFSRFDHFRADKENTALQYESKKIRAAAERKRQREVTQLSDDLREQEFLRAFSMASYSQARQSHAFETAVLQRASEIVGGMNCDRRPGIVSVKAGNAPSNGQHNGKH